MKSRLQSKYILIILCMSMATPLVADVVEGPISVAQGCREPYALQKHYAKLIASSFMFLSLLRLYTKKPQPTIAYPQDDTLAEWVRYIWDEKWVGQCKKPKELKGFDPQTGVALYEKCEATGVLGSLVSPLKDIIIPLAIFWTTYEDTIRKIVLGLEKWVNPNLAPDCSQQKK